MSRRAEFENGRTEQLRMFMPVEEIIDTVHKNDSRLSGFQWSPRDQWEHPESGVDYHNSAIDRPLREEKLGKLDRNEYTQRDFNRPWLSAPPVELFHGPPGSRTWAPGKTLIEGHHRLAHAERAGIPFIAVRHDWIGKK